MRIARVCPAVLLAVPIVALAGPAAAASGLQVTGTSGTLTFTASSSAPLVQFLFDGSPVGAPVAVSGGTASTGFDSWGYANATHEVAAADCTDAATCASPDATAQVTLANSDPQLTAPADGSHVLGGFDVTATTPGGALGYAVDGQKPFAVLPGATSTASYRGTALTPGAHTVSVTECAGTDGTQCEGPSASVRVVADALRPQIRSLLPDPFSPLHAAATLRFTLPDPERVSVTVRSAAGDIVRGPAALGPLGAGNHSWAWRGRTGAGALAPDGGYRVVLSTSRVVNGVTVTGSAGRWVVLDATAPTITAVTGSGTTFFPVRDGYRDTFTPSARLSEPALLALHVLDAHGHVVRLVQGRRARGRAALTWDGRTAAGRLVAAGTYRWYFSATDAAGNVTRTAAAAVVVSAQRLVAHTATIVQTGTSAVRTVATDTSCGEASRTDSDYPQGLWLVNGCYQSTKPAVVTAFYQVDLPAATRYDRIAVTVDGYSLFAPSRLHAVYRNATTGRWDPGADVTVRTARKGLHALGAVAGSGHAARRVAAIGVAVDNVGAPSDIDIARVLVTVGYSVLG